jgi:hypothetical protein
VVFALTACDGSQSVPDVVQERDSAGIRIVEHPQLDSFPTSRVPQEPILRVGWSEDGPAFERLSGGAILGDGAVVVDGRGARAYFLAAGGEVNEVGRRGDGPGEFQSPSSVILGPDSEVFVWDLGTGRLSTFSRTGDFLASDLVQLAGAAGLGPTQLIGDSTLAWVPQSITLRADGGESTWLEGPLMLSDRRGSSADTVAHVPFVKLELEDGRPNSNPFVFFGGGGAFRGGFVWARNDQTEATWFDPSGDVRLVARWATRPTRVDDETWGRFEADLRARNDAAGSPLDSPAIEQRLRNLRADASETLPFFRFANVAEDGTLWLSEYTFSGDFASRFLRVAPDGRVQGWLEFPRPIRVLAIAGDRVLGIEENEWDVQSAVIYSIGR